MAEIKLEDIKPNSHKSKNESEKTTTREKIAPVVSKSAVVSTKKPLSQKFAETFITEDVRDIKTYLLTDVIVPGIKNTILDILSMMFFGEVGGKRSSGSYYSSNSKVSYSSYYSGRDKKKNQSNRDPIRDNELDYRHIILNNRADAEEVVEQMRDRIVRYGQVSVADLFDLVDVTGRYTDNNWGWTDPRDIGIRRISNGFLIDVSEAKLLDD